MMTAPAARTVAKAAATKAATQAAQKGAKGVARTPRNAAQKGDRYERAIKSEWLIGIILMWIYPLIKPDFVRGFNHWISRMLAWTAVHIGLLLIAGIGPRAGRLAAAFGGLTLLMLLLAPFADGSPFGRRIADGAAIMMGRPPRENVIPPFNGGQWIRDLLDTSPPGHGTGPPESRPPIPFPPTTG